MNKHGLPLPIAKRLVSEVHEGFCLERLTLSDSIEDLHRYCFTVCGNEQSGVQGVRSAADASGSFTGFVRGQRTAFSSGRVADCRTGIL